MNETDYSDVFESSQKSYTCMWARRTHSHTQRQHPTMSHFSQDMSVPEHVHKENQLYTVLTLCQSGRWSTLGGRGRLNPCALCHHAPTRRKVFSWGSLLCLLVIFFLPALSSTAFINCTCHFLFILPPNFVSIYCPLLCCITLLDPHRLLRLSSCHSHFSLPSLKSRLLPLAECDKGLQAKPALMTSQPHHLNGLPPTLLSWELIGCNLSQWEANSHWGRWIWGGDVG